MTKEKEIMQQMFDQAVTGLLEQGCQSLCDSGQDCRYRDAKGNKCWVGHLITDEAYHKDLEDKPVIGSPDVVEALIKSGWPIKRYAYPHSKMMHFLRHGQGIHDKMHNPSLPRSWPAEYKELAKKYDLDPSCIDSCQSVNI